MHALLVGARLLTRSGRQPDDISSIVLVEKDRAFIRSEAVLRIASQLRLPLPLISMLGSPVPLVIRDPLYDLVANNRYRLMGMRSECRLPDAAFQERFLAE